MSASDTFFQTKVLYLLSDRSIEENLFLVIFELRLILV